MSDDKTITEAKREFMQRCDECPKAHDFTCCGAEAEKCLKNAEEKLRKAILANK